MKVIDDFLYEQDFKDLEDYILGPAVHWKYNPFKVKQSEDTDSFQFVHVVFEPTRFPVSIERSMVACDPIFATLTKRHQFDIMHRVKINLTPRTVEHNYTAWHTDTKQHNKTAIFYVNTNNGFTRFKDGTKVMSKANRMVIFDAQTEHSGVTCTDEKVRVVININYFPKILT